MKIKKFFLINILLFSQVISSEYYVDRFLRPFCPDYKKEGSLEEASLLGMIITLGATTANKFECALYLSTDGTYKSDCLELSCRQKNHRVILDNASHVINISRDVINDKNTSDSLKRKTTKGLIAINKAFNQWKKVSPKPYMDYSKVKYIEKNLNAPLENLVIKQLEILPNSAITKYFDVLNSQKLKKFAAEQKKKRIAAEQEAEKKRKREELLMKVAAKEAEIERERIALYNEQKKIAADKEEARKAAEEEWRRRKELKDFQELLKTLLWSLLFLSLFSLAIINNKKKIREKEEEKRKLEDELLKEDRRKRRHQIKKERAKLLEEIDQLMSEYEILYLERLNKYKNQFKEITRTISEEEKQLIELKSRHPKIETLVSSRKIGDSSSKIIKELKELFAKF